MFPSECNKTRVHFEKVQRDFSLKAQKMCLLYLCHKYDLGVLDSCYGMDYKFIAQIMVVSYIKYLEIHVHPETWGHYDLEPFNVEQHKEEKTENVTKAS